MSDEERKVVVVTGASAGVGRAVCDLFAENGFNVGLLSREPYRLREAVTAVEARGARAIGIPTDVADADAVDIAAALVETELGPIDVWINVAMATVFAPVDKLAPQEIKRGTEVTYLGQVHGMLAALKRMRPRNRGIIINVSSALAYRSVPLQAVYCGAKAAVRGFTDSLRSELLHDHIDIQVTVVDLPAINTPQFGWARNKTGRRARPVAPVYEPEVAARAVLEAATHRRRNLWVGLSTIKAIAGKSLLPGFLDRYLAKAAYDGQLMDETVIETPGNLFDLVSGPSSAQGMFSDEAKQQIDVTIRR